jgi:hypothetical protein
VRRADNSSRGVLPTKKKLIMINLGFVYFTHFVPQNLLRILVHILCLLTLRLLMSYIYGAPILDVSRSHTTTQHSR